MAVHEWFQPLDWIVLFGYLGLTTWVGHKMRGRQASISDFFAGGRSLPWLAVSGSIVATEISGVTFIGVPGGVLAAGGDFTYMIWALGSILGRVIVGIWFTRVFYEDGIYSPYDYMGRRIKPQLKTLATVFFTIGSILAQSVRVLVAAIPLMIVTPFSFEVCILLIGIFAIGWTLMGGMRTVIWTDVMQFFLFAVGGLITLIWAWMHLGGGWLDVAAQAGKTHWLSFDAGVSDAFQFTFWVAVFAVPFLNVGAFGVDQLNAQRMFCCRNAQDARKAIIWSSVGQVITLLMLMVGAALFVWYSRFPPEGVVAEKMAWNSGGGVPGEAARVFPIWIVKELPPGLSGLILGGVFAAAISSLDSILAALSQTTVSVLYDADGAQSEDEQRRMVSRSRVLVVLWGLFLTVFTLLMRWVQKNTEVEVLPLAFGMTTYTIGPLLGMFLCALLGRGSFRGLIWGSVLSFIAVLFIRSDFWVLLHTFELDLFGLSLGFNMPYEWLAALPMYFIEGQGDAQSLKTTVGFYWAWPATTILTFGLGVLWPKSSGKARIRAV
ncbi:MAG: hypothetical protein CMN04_03330 [Roseibacillus sp.]|nr:hypothetical protein [Roseibacillus sp.]|tara:strand:- start:734 stop:2380 length:1647 start_codon:yes stop_codon:yes gene_type:complete